MAASVETKTTFAINPARFDPRGTRSGDPRAETQVAERRRGQTGGRMRGASELRRGAVDRAGEVAIAPAAGHGARLLVGRRKGGRR